MSGEHDPAGWAAARGTDVDSFSNDRFTKPGPWGAVGRPRSAGVLERFHEPRGTDRGLRNQLRQHSDVAGLGRGRGVAKTRRCLGVAVAEIGAVLAGGAGSAALQLCLSLKP